MNSLPTNAVLLIIDVQQGMDDPKWGERNNPDAEENMARLLSAWRKSDWTVFHVQHLSTSADSPLRPGQPGVEIKEEVKPRAGEPLFQKRVNSAFIGTDLEERLRSGGHDTLVIVGLTTPHCVSTTTRMAGNLCFEAIIVSDATAAFELTDHHGRRYTAEEVHNLSLAALNGEFAMVLDTDQILESL